MRDIKQSAQWLAYRRAHPATQPTVALFGDSLAEQWPLGLSFGVLPTANYGVGGEGAERAMSRLHAALASHPRVLILFIGINDIGRQREPDAIARDVESMLGQAETAGTAVVLCGPPPVRDEFLERHPQAKVAALNATFRQLAAKHHVAFADLHALLAGVDGLAQPEFSKDGLHLSIAGYYRLASAIHALVMRRAFGDR